MKGVILAGGTGSRLYPLTKVVNKHLLPIGRYPMIYHGLYKLKKAGITDVLIITGPGHMGDIVNQLGSGREFGILLSYRVQEQPGGIAEALALAEPFVHGNPMVVILGDNIFSADLTPFIKKFKQQEKGAKILIKEVRNPKQFGVPELGQDCVIGIEEKPNVPKSNYAVTGIYMYSNDVFEIIHQQTVSSRNELEITDVNNIYIQRGLLSYDILPGWWKDAGTLSSLFEANMRAMEMEYRD